MRRDHGLTTFGAAAEELGVFAHTVGDLVRAWGIAPKPMSHGRAKGLDKADMDILRMALNRGRKAQPRKRMVAL